MKRIVRPRRLQHRGMIDAAGFIVEPTVIGTLKARRRILRSWVAGSRVALWEDTLVLLLPGSKPIACDASPGTPLERCGHILCGIPLDPAELNAIDADAGSIIMPRAGAVVVVRGDKLHTVDPSTWIDISHFVAVDARSLVHAPMPVQQILQPISFDGRRALAKISHEPEGRADLLAALRRGRGTSGGKGPGILQHIGNGIVRLFARMIENMARPSDQGGTGSRRNSGRENGNAGTTGNDQPLNRLQQLARQLLWKSKIGMLLGRSHARYLQRMMEIFNSGDIIEGLRHAIPIGGDHEKDEWPGFSAPIARNSLQLHMQGSRAGGSIGLDADVIEMLRSRYRKGAELLASQGKIEEAAYVIADLLGNVQEAVDFLERHDRIELAARLAEARSLPAEQTIRLWFLAGNRERAIAIAKYSGAFAGAVTQMESAGKIDQARELRMLWSDLLAEAGNYAAAVDIIWPVKEERERALPWINVLIEHGGPTGARMMGRALTADFGGSREFLQSALDLLDNDNPEDALRRLMLAAELPLSGKNDLRPLARVAIRSLVRDAGRLYDVRISSTIGALLKFSNDGALRADVRTNRPPQGNTPSLVTSASTVTVYIGSDDTGALRLHDAVLLDTGGMLVALGEMGVRLLSQDGRTTCHFNQPADALVMSDNSSRVITIARRNRQDIVRLGRIDLAARCALHWCEAIVTTWADSFDGVVWIAAGKDEVLVVDATAADFRSLWHWSQPPLRPLSIARQGNSCSFLMHVPFKEPGSDLSTETWQVALQSLTLRSRTTVPPTQGPEITSFVVAPGGRTSRLLLDIATGIVNGVGTPLGTAEGTLLIDEVKVYQYDGMVTERPFHRMNSDYTTLVIYSPEGATCRLFANSSRKLCATITLEGALHVTTRLSDTHLAVCDDRGRLLVIDLDTGDVLRNLRIV